MNVIYIRYFLYTFEKAAMRCVFFKESSCYTNMGSGFDIFFVLYYNKGCPFLTNEMELRYL